MENGQITVQVAINLEKIEKNTIKEIIDLMNCAVKDKEVVNIIEGRHRIELIMQDFKDKTQESKIVVDMSTNSYYINGLTRFANDSYYDQKVFDILKKITNTVKVHKTRILNDIKVENQYNIIN